MFINSISGLELRGKTYYLRVRVPKAYADVEPRKEINRSLKTRDRCEAESRCLIAKKALIQEWEALKAGRSKDQRSVFDAASNLLKGWGMTFCPMDDLINGPLDEILARLDKLTEATTDTVAVPALLGAVDLPDCPLYEMAQRMPILKAANIRAKNARQKREWSNNYTRAADIFSKQIGKRTVLTISEQDAIDYEVFWKKRHESGEVIANYANKQIRYVRQMVYAHFDDIRLPRSKRKNPFLGMRVSKVAFDPIDHAHRKLPLPELWIRDKLIGERILEGHHQEDSDIAIISAECGTRGTEVYDVPPEDIFLDHEIPHFLIRVITDGPNKNEIKNLASTRPIVLLGNSFEAMQRNRAGFPRHRGKASYSSQVNAYLRDNKYFPEPPVGQDRTYTISCTRHSFEDRMKAAKMDNEERAYLMGQPYNFKAVVERSAYLANGNSSR
jgi:hypothetical protein